MAKLSTRVIDTPQSTQASSGLHLDHLGYHFYNKERLSGETDVSFRERLLGSGRNSMNTNFNTKQENTMTTNTLREIILTLIDNNSNLEDAQRVVFQKKSVRTSFTDQQAKEDIIATGEVMTALKKHNEEVRAKVVREDILENTGREVTLKPIKLLSDSQLEWRIIATA